MALHHAAAAAAAAAAPAPQPQPQAQPQPQPHYVRRSRRRRQRQPKQQRICLRGTTHETRFAAFFSAATTTTTVVIVACLMLLLAATATMGADAVAAAATYASPSPLLSSSIVARRPYHSSCRNGAFNGAFALASYSPFRTQQRRRRGSHRPLTTLKAAAAASSSSDDDSAETSPTAPTSSQPPPPTRRRRYFATCIPGLQNILSDELTSLGAMNVVPSGKSGVSFEGDDESVGLKSLLWVRSAHRIMECVSSTEESGGDYDDGTYVEEGYGDDFDIDGYGGGGPGYELLTNRNDLYTFIRQSVDPKSLLGNGRGGLLTLSVQTILNGHVPRDLCHSHYTSLTVKNALVDSVRDLREDGIRPDVDLKDADVPLVLVLRGVESGRRGGGGGKWRTRRGGEGDDDGSAASATLYRCLHPGGSSLHRRGYRTAAGTPSSSSYDSDADDGNDDGGATTSTPIHKAAMKESLAAGLLLASGWDKLVADARYSENGLPAILIDPMCGSGTFPIEAGLIAADVAPGLVRIKCHQPSSGRRDGNNDNNPHRVPPAVRWKGSSLSTWNALLTDAVKRAQEGMKWCRSTNELHPHLTNVSIRCNEVHNGAASLASSGIARAGLTNVVSPPRIGDCASWDLGGGGGGGGDADGTTSGKEEERMVVEGRTIITTNPPWGVRLTDDVVPSWESLRTFLRREGHGAEAWVLSGHKSLTKHLKMKRSRIVGPIRTADEDLRWIQYHIFDYRGGEGTKVEDVDEGVESEVEERRRSKQQRGREQYEDDGGNVIGEGAKETSGDRIKSAAEAWY